MQINLFMVNHQVLAAGQENSPSLCFGNNEDIGRRVCRESLEVEREWWDGPSLN